jgi:hypothetical protein
MRVSGDIEVFSPGEVAIVLHLCIAYCIRPRAIPRLATTATAI